MNFWVYGKNSGVPIEDIVGAVGLTVEQVQRAFRGIDQKRKTTRYLHLIPELTTDIPEISHYSSA